MTATVLTVAGLLALGGYALAWYLPVLIEEWRWIDYSEYLRRMEKVAPKRRA